MESHAESALSSLSPHKEQSISIVGRRVPQTQPVQLNTQSKRPRVVEAKRSASRGRGRSLTRSPIRSTSQRLSKHHKQQGNTQAYYSPPRHCQASSSKADLTGSRSQRSVFTEHNIRAMLEKSQQQATNKEKERWLVKERMEKVNKRIRKLNAKKGKRAMGKHPKPWGCDQRTKDETNKRINAENEEIRKRIRAEREKAKMEGRKAIGLELYPMVKHKAKADNVDETQKSKRSPDPSIRKYMKQKNKTRRIKDLQKVFEDTVKERDRIHALEKLDSTMKKKPGKKGKKKKLKAKNKELTERSGELMNSLSQISAVNGFSAKKPKLETQHTESNEFLSERFKQLQQRVNMQYAELKESAAIIIQRWYRRVKNNRRLEGNGLHIPLLTLHSSETNSKNTSEHITSPAGGWIDFLSPSSNKKSIKVQEIKQFRDKINPKHKETNQNIEEYVTKTPERGAGPSKTCPTGATEESPLPSLNSISKNDKPNSTSFHFQIKRPKALDIDHINMPLLNPVVERADDNLEAEKIEWSRESEKINEKGSPSFPQIEKKHGFSLICSQESREFYESMSFQSKSESDSSLERGNKRSIIEEQESMEKRNEAELDELSLHSFQALKEEIAVILDKDSLDEGFSICSLTDIKEKEEELFAALDEIVPNADVDKIFQVSNDNYTDVERKSIDLRIKRLIPTDEQKNPDVDYVEKIAQVSDDHYRASVRQSPDLRVKNTIPTDEQEKSEDDYNNKADSHISSIENFTIPDNSPANIPSGLNPDCAALIESSSSPVQPPPSDPVSLSPPLSERFPPTLSISNPVPIQAPISSFFNLKSCNSTPSSPSYSISDLLIEVIDQELDSYTSLIRFSLKEHDVDPSVQFIDKYLSILYEETLPDSSTVLELMNTPAFQDPLIKLVVLENTEVGELSKFPNLELILPLEFNLRMKERFGNYSKPRNIYLQMIFDSVNEAINVLRPFGMDGVPDPWMLQPRLLFGDGELRSVFKKITKTLTKWAEIKGGAYPSADIKEDEDKLQEVREERMSALLCFDAEEEESHWVKYDDEETQTKLDLADILFELIVSETAELVRQFNFLI